MPALQIHRDFRSIQKLEFCYHCGVKFNATSDRDRDHVPPKAVFSIADRQLNPLILPTHTKCNSGHSAKDEVVGQLISVIHGRHPPEGQAKLRVEATMIPGSAVPMGGFIGVDLHGVIGRWVRAFHAALYREFLPFATRSSIHPPFPTGEMLANGDWRMHSILPQHLQFVEAIKSNRAAGKLDRIECFNQKCVYECVWERMDDGTWACIFGLQVYNWKTLGDSVHFPSRGCVGLYMPAAGKPVDGTTGIFRVIEMPIKNLDPLDPFGR
jgi:hypothetical protein